MIGIRLFPEAQWDLVGSLGGQMRLAGKAVLGLNMGAALSVAQAQGLNPMAVAKLKVMRVCGINEMIATSD